MKDFTGAELKHNDLVVSKPGGRYAYMHYGLIRDELKVSVWFGRGSWGGSDIVKINTEGRPDMEAKRQELITKREKELTDREEARKRKKATKLKKSELTRFGVFVSDYEREVNLGKCTVDGVEKENVWLTVSYPYTKHGEEPKRGKEHLKTEGRTRSVKYPQKFKMEHQLTKEEVEGIIAEYVDRLIKNESKSRYWISYRKPKIIKLLEG